MKLTMFSDPGHAWLFVSSAQLYTLRLTINSLTRWSYYDRAGVYAEEDCDAFLVIAAHKRIVEDGPPAGRRKLTIDYVDYEEESAYIRGLPRCGVYDQILRNPKIARRA